MLNTIKQTNKQNRWISLTPVTLVSSSNKTDRHDITDILLIVAVSFIGGGPGENHRLVASH
jgi:hypothetical protein